MVAGRTHRPIIDPLRCGQCSVCRRGCPGEIIREYSHEEGSLRGEIYRHREPGLVPTPGENLPPAPCQQACPLGQDVTVIPSVRIPYFDPETKTYGVAESAAIPITVKPAEMVTAFDAAMRGVGPLRNHIDKNPRGIRANVASVHAVDERVLSGHHWLVLLLVLPPLGFVVFYGATARQRLAMNDPVKARALGAMQRFRRSVARMSRSGEQAPAQKLGQLDDAVRAYLADTLNLLRHAHTFEELEGVLGGRVDIEPLRQVYASAEYEKYRGTASHADVNALIRQAEQCIQSIHQVKS